MNEEQFNHIAERLKEAATQAHPPFTEEAWERMEKMLDEQDRKKRPVFPLWFLTAFIVILSAGMIFWFVKDSGGPHTLSHEEQRMQDLKSDEELAALKSSTGKSENNKTAQYDANQISPTNFNRADSIKLYNTARQMEFPAARLGSQISEVIAAINRNHKLSEKARTSISIGVPEQERDSNQKETDRTKTTVGHDVNLTLPEEIITTYIKKDSLASDPVAVAGNRETDDNNKDSSIFKTASIKTKETKKKSTFSDRFFIAGTIGPEVSGVRFPGFENSSSSLRSGMAAGYKISERFSVKLGFYNSKKIYSAGPQDYHPKAGSYLYAVKFTGAYADCRVYDIPVTIQYDFVVSKKNRGFFTAGLSSYIMKKEDYTYKFTYYNIAAQSKHHYTGNSYFGSNFNISTGFARQLSRRTAFTFEPSVSIPLRGVGDGHVKLYSSSINVGLRYTPF